ncbi:hypothetical protein JCM21714_3032 [Gracilibacillus boraciitolerans JCM 21714]|uniref:DoxX family protein n=2 Tax=Gracilibacillus boraciitolerans TaxID=307521 RepID=W4VM95_9BACI|nr:hypothetical protein JCM21714_3032 [Gracilibacillus boraciitolerans JCM 21714]
MESPYPEMAVLLVGLTELIGGICIICNYYVKKAAIPLLVIIIAAIILAKVPILSSGIFQFAFEVRLEILMVLLLYILWKH